MSRRTIEPGKHTTASGPTRPRPSDRASRASGSHRRLRSSRCPVAIAPCRDRPSDHRPSGDPTRWTVEQSTSSPVDRVTHTIASPGQAPPTGNDSMASAARAGYAAAASARTSARWSLVAAVDRRTSSLETGGDWPMPDELGGSDGRSLLRRPSKLLLEPRDGRLHLGDDAVAGRQAARTTRIDATPRAGRHDRTSRCARHPGRGGAGPLVHPAPDADRVRRGPEPA